MNTSDIRKCWKCGKRKLSDQKWGITRKEQKQHIIAQTDFFFCTKYAVIMKYSGGTFTFCAANYAEQFVARIFLD